MKGTPRSLLTPARRVATIIHLCVIVLAGYGALSAKLAGAEPASGKPPRDDPEVKKLAKEVASLGWLAFAGKSGNGDYDLYLCRPDGSQLRNITQTPQWNEFCVRLFPDGKSFV